MTIHRRALWDFLQHGLLLSLRIRVLFEHEQGACWTDQERFQCPKS